MTALAGCPFCGAEPFIGPSDPMKEGDAWTEILCVNRRCTAEVRVVVYADRGHRAMAIRRWNKRTKDSLTAGPRAVGNINNNEENGNG